MLIFPLFFRLQALGGPVLLSQIGTVGAGVGVAVGAGAAGRALSAAGVGRRGADRAGHRADGVGAAQDLKGLKCY